MNTFTTMVIWFIYCVTIFLVGVGGQDYYPCVQQTTEYGTVCVCNSTYCDTVPPLQTLEPGQYQLYTTSASNLGFSTVTGSFGDGSLALASVSISNLTATKQTIIGFGGAFTDATGINIRRLSSGAQENLLQGYFGENGIQYSIGRVPIGGTDFSTRGYTYCDQEDETLDSFALQPEDLEDKIPYIQRALDIRGINNISLFASVWSAPLWMKTNQSYGGVTAVQDKYYDLFAQYYVKFFEEYAKHNVSFWGVTTQNEPADGVLGVVVQNNGFTPKQMTNWIKNSLGPAIRNSTFTDLKIILHDDQIVFLPLLTSGVLNDPAVVDYADGIGVHWYWDTFVPYSLIYGLIPSSFEGTNSTKTPFRMGTEACNGYLSLLGLESAVQLGSWSRGQKYITDIIKDFSYDFVSWVDWNMALNETGGPNWINNEVDAPIIVNNTVDEFYKQPMFYALGHFSKFVVPGSKRLESTVIGLGLESISFLRPDGKIAVILANTFNVTLEVKVQIEDRSNVFTLAAQSLNTVLYTPT